MTPVLCRKIGAVASRRLGTLFAVSLALIATIDAVAFIDFRELRHVLPVAGTALAWAWAALCCGVWFAPPDAGQASASRFRRFLAPFSMTRQPDVLQWPFAIMAGLVAVAFPLFLVFFSRQA